ncbi:hypothetical protein ACS0TY_000183 [Phlomoides rotata]
MLCMLDGNQRMVSGLVSNESWKRADPCVKGLRYKIWLYYPQWIEIFGKDMATGENAVDPIDLVNELYNNGLDRKWEIGERYVALSPDTLHDVEDNNNRKQNEAEFKGKARGQKRKVCDPDITMLVALGEFMKFLKVAMTDLSAGNDKGVMSSNENKRLNDIMNGIIGLKLSDKLKVCDELVQNSKRLDFFLSLPTNEQEEYVWMLLDGRI